MIYVGGIVPVMVVDGSYSLNEHATAVGVENEMYTFFGADHVPYYSDPDYMDTTISFVSNFLYRQFGCTPSDPTPQANTFPTGIDEYNLIQHSAFPNPVQSSVYFSFSSPIDALTIYDISGKEQMIVEVNSNEYNADLSVLSPGMYFYKALSGKYALTGKIIKQ